MLIDLKKGKRGDANCFLTNVIMAQVYGTSCKPSSKAANKKSSLIQYYEVGNAFTRDASMLFL